VKIAIFSDTFFPDMNGVARTLKRFCDYLDTINISYKIFAPDSFENDDSSHQIHRFKSLSFFLYPECRLAFPNILRMKMELQSFSPDIIHVATPFNIGLCGLYFAKQWKIPLVGSYHTNFDQYLKYYDLQLLSKPILKYMYWFHKPCLKLFVPSLETFNQLKNNGFEHLEIWPRGVDCKLFHPYHDQIAVRNRFELSKKYLLTYVGRLAPEKDVHTLLEVSRHLPKEFSNSIDWLIIGDGPLREELERKAPDNMNFTGYLQGKRLAEVYSASDLFIFPSATETFGNVVLEALASGTPVIGANAGGVKNIIQPGVTGELCSPGSFSHFSNTIQQLISNDSKRVQMGWEGRKYALLQKWDTIFEKIIWHYQDVIKKNRGKKYA
jgi:glycosyltransferase involved in cell wall biosynthesis